jgi:hypothetical protein
MKITDSNSIIVIQKKFRLSVLQKENDV